MNLINVQKIECLDLHNSQSQLRKNAYLINDDVIIEHNHLACNKKDAPASKIVNCEARDDYNLVLLEDGSYSFLDHKEMIVPQRYDVASNFLDGHAIVGKDGFVTIIDSCFQHLDKYGYFVYGGADLSMTEGFSTAERLLKSENRLIKLVNKKGQIMFFNPIAKRIQGFIRFSTKMDARLFFEGQFTRDFDESGTAETENGILLLESGYYFTPEDLILFSVDGNDIQKLRALVPKRKPSSSVIHVK